MLRNLSSNEELFWGKLVPFGSRGCLIDPRMDHQAFISLTAMPTMLASGFDCQKCQKSHQDLVLLAPQIAPNIVQRVTKDRMTLFEIDAQQHRDQCQNFSSGHNFMDKTVDSTQIGKKRPF